MTLQDVEFGDRVVVERTEFGRTTAHPEIVRKVTAKRIQAGYSWKTLMFDRQTGECVSGKMRWVQYRVRIPEPGELLRYDATEAERNRVAEALETGKRAHEASESHMLACKINIGHEALERLPIEDLRKIAGLVKGVQ